MPIMYGSLNDQNNSTVPLTDEKLSTSSTNGSSARKFTAQDQIEPIPTNLVGNAQHLIDSAVSLKQMAMTVDAMATIARDSLAVSRQNVENVRATDVQTTSTQIAPDKMLLDQSVLGLEIGKSLFGDDASGVRFTQEIITQTHSDFIGSKQQSNVLFFNDTTPEIDSVSVDIDKQKGVVDCFFSTLKFSIPTNKATNGRIKAFKIMRSMDMNPMFTRGLGNLSLHGIDRLRSEPNSSRQKNLNTLMQFEKRLVESNVKNSVTNLVPIDSSTNLRNSAEEKPVDTTTIDSSVASDPRTIDIVANENSLDLSQKEIIVGKLPDQASKNQFAVDMSNSNGFKQVAFVSPDKLTAKQIGDSSQYTFEDPSITFGRGYTYYVSTINSDMVESVRSPLITIVIEGLRVPEMPKMFKAYQIDKTICLSMLVDDQLVEKFEIYRKELNVKPTTRFNSARVISADSGFTSSVMTMVTLPNGFVYLGDSLNGSRGAGASFNDITAKPGAKYIYRVFSVDVFGNKSEKPAEAQIFFKDKFSKTVDLDTPHMTVEIDAKSNKMKITFGCVDQRVTAMFLTRRDLTIDQEIFTTPGEVSRNQLGTSQPGQGPNRFLGSKIVGSQTDRPWNGLFMNDGSDIVFIDTTVAFDHTYRYKLEGNDKFGNKTSCVVSNAVFVNRHPMIDDPVNLTSSVDLSGSTIQGITLQWQDGNVSVTAEDKLGSQAKLTDTSVRNLYQLERRNSNDDKWSKFSLISETSFFDPTPSFAGNEVPAFRPQFVVENQTYLYRVKAVQSGAFMSNYSTQVQVFAGLQVLAPEKLRISSCDAKIRPFYTIINWSTPEGSGQIDKWDIEKAEINNYAAASMNMADPDVFKNIRFSAFRSVGRESGRFRSLTADNVLTEDTSSAISGMYHFQDAQVSFGNTYFYRIRAVGLDGRQSGWVYGGMRVTDTTFEKKLESIITNEERLELSNMKLPLTVKGNVLGEQTNVETSSFSLNPSFSKPAPTKSFKV